MSVASPLDEPLFDSQWHLRNTEQLVGSTEFQEILGSSRRRYPRRQCLESRLQRGRRRNRRRRSGFQGTHPDLADNYRADLSFGSVSGPHGTAIAGLIGAEATIITVPSALLITPTSSRWELEPRSGLGLDCQYP